MHADETMHCKPWYNVFFLLFTAIYTRVIPGVLLPKADAADLEIWNQDYDRSKWLFTTDICRLWTVCIV